jgi:hypothetical protein
MPKLIQAAAAAFLISNSLSFSPPQPRSVRHIPLTSNPTTTLLYSANDSELEAQKLQEKASQYRQEAEKLRLNLELKKIDELTDEIKEFAKGRDFAQQTRDSISMGSGMTQSDGKKLEQLRGKVADLVRTSTVINKEDAERMLGSLGTSSKESSTQSASSKEVKFTQEEIDAAMYLIEALPQAARETIAITAGYLSYREAKANPKDFVEQLASHQVSNMALRRVYAQSLVKDPNAKVIVVDETYSIEDIADALVEDLQERMDSNRAMELYPRSVQDMDEDLLPTEEDADAIFRLLDKSTFMATEKPIKVNGGYIIRGVNKRSTSVDLIEAIDKKIEKSFPKFTESFQVNYVEITADPADDEFIEDSLLITANKFPVAAPLPLGLLTTGISCFWAFTYGINTFGGNPVVMQKLKEANDAATALASGSTGIDTSTYDLSWFNELLLPLLGSLALIQGVHELGHLTVAWANKVRLTKKCSV